MGPVGVSPLAQRGFTCCTGICLHAVGAAVLSDPSFAHPSGPRHPLRRPTLDTPPSLALLAAPLPGVPSAKAVLTGVAAGGPWVIFLLRLSPLVPFNLLNYTLGLTPVGLLPYVGASWVGMLPGTFAYVYLGGAGKAAVDAASGGMDTKTIVLYGECWAVVMPWLGVTAWHGVRGVLRSGRGLALRGCAAARVRSKQVCQQDVGALMRCRALASSQCCSPDAN